MDAIADSTVLLVPVVKLTPLPNLLPNGFEVVEGATGPTLPEPELPPPSPVLAPQAEL